MTKISRMTLGSIDNLVENSEDIEIVGEGCIKASRWNVDTLNIVMPNEMKLLRTDSKVACSKRSEFLGIVEGYLAEQGLYMVEVDYTPERWSGFFPHKIEGIFCREN